MSYEKRFPDWEQRVIEASLSNISASAAAASLGIKIDTYKKYAVKYNCYVTNQAGRGMNKQASHGYDLGEVLSGLHPQYGSAKIRVRLLKEGIFEHRCNQCRLEEWLGQPIPLELEHKDGCHTNHKLENLELLCPNCHALTETYAGRNKAYK